MCVIPLRGDFIQAGRDEPGAGERPGGGVEDLLAVLGPAQAAYRPGLGAPPPRLAGRKARSLSTLLLFPRMPVPGDLARAAPAG